MLLYDEKFKRPSYVHDRNLKNTYDPQPRGAEHCQDCPTIFPYKLFISTSWKVCIKTYKTRYVYIAQSI